MCVHLVADGDLTIANIPLTKDNCDLQQVKTLDAAPKLIILYSMSSVLDRKSKKLNLVQ